MSIFNKHNVQLATRWLGFIGSLLTIMIGTINILSRNPFIHISGSSKFFEDVQVLSWRKTLFSLSPDVLADVWSPFIIGVIGILAHCNNSIFERFITKNFGYYFTFNLFQGLFATIAYCGMLGVVCSVPVFFCALLCLILLLISDTNASLKLEYKANNYSLQ